MLITKRDTTSLGREIFKTRNFRIIRTSSLDFHYFFANQKKIVQGHIDLRKKKYRLIPLFITSFTITFFLGFGLEQSSARMEPSQLKNSASSIVSEENDEIDKDAKRGDERFLQDSEEKKWAVLRASEIESDQKEKARKLKVTAYRVLKNETLSEIANKFKVSIDSIAGSSGINPDDTIFHGQILQIPNKQGLLYKFKKGDSLAKVADFYKVKIEDVTIENGNQDYDFVKVGQKLFLPGAVIPEPKPKWVVPVASRIITSGYGYRTFPRKKFHEALDLKANYETVTAARKGKVIYAGWMGGYGNTVVIEHDSDYKTLYAHNSKIYVKSGDYVQGGHKISRSGCTGFCFGPHVHFELIHKGKNINPTKVLKGLSYKK
ncbi:LysM peptidoglycan-binding domain-containing M23 family metallopeptidase [Leptospira sp. GIMC2001]|uniref:LysM peptidoglycan-binding domain-containing M23 family metallopeptidase n=1 Tax=Leptospira sp. GIMC2001 TaxID=1513297 RepID=UPI0023490D95|nr:M23 family metallopeptidase [Leptospira sp. GIMC2001]WCL50880.1 peptidoglycan DD-metalloendopeptidase family protein [Leptospira sp. GIMC2001]